MTTFDLTDDRKSHPVSIGLDLDEYGDLRMWISVSDEDNSVSLPQQHSLLTMAKGICSAVMTNPALARKFGEDAAKELEEDYPYFHDVRRILAQRKADKINEKLKKASTKLRLVTINGEQVHDV